MATRWWVGTTTDWNTASNWATTEGGAGGAGVPTSIDDVYFSNTSSILDCILSANAQCNTLSTRTTETLGTDNWSHILDIGNYTITISNACHFQGVDVSNKVTFRANTSGVLNGNGINFHTNTIVDGKTTSQINNSGDYFCENEIIFLLLGLFVYTQTANANVNSPLYNNRFREFILNDGVTITLTGGFNATTYSTVINGIMNVNGFTFTIGADSSNFTIGANADFQGVGEIIFVCLESATQTINKRVFPNFTGTLFYRKYSPVDITVFAFEAVNAIVKIGGENTPAIKYVESGDIKATQFEIINDNNYDQDVYSNLTNYYISGDVLFHTGTGVYATNWFRNPYENWILSGASNVISNATLKILGNINILSGASYTSDNDLEANTLQVDGTLTFTAGKSYTFENIKGIGTLSCLTPIIIYYKGDNNFNGTLNNVTLKSMGGGQANTKAYYGLGVDRGLNINL